MRVKKALLLLMCFCFIGIVAPMKSAHAQVDSIIIAQAQRQFRVVLVFQDPTGRTGELVTNRVMASSASEAEQIRRRQFLSANPGSRVIRVTATLVN